MLRQKDVVAIQKANNGCTGVLESQVARGANATVDRVGVLQKPDTPVARLVLPQQLGTAVTRAVIDHDELPGRAGLLLKHTLKSVAQVRLAVPDRHEDGNCRMCRGLVEVEVHHGYCYRAAGAGVLH